MKTTTLTTLVTLTTLTTALPIRQLSTVNLRLFSSLSTHYTPSTQIPSTAPGDSILHITVGQALSFDHAPLEISAIEVAEVNAGTDLSSPPKFIAQDSDEVVCEAKVGYSSMGVRFKVGYGPVAIGEGDLTEVTGLECWVE